MKIRLRCHYRDKEFHLFIYKQKDKYKRIVHKNQLARIMQDLQDKQILRVDNVLMRLNKKNAIYVHDYFSQLQEKYE